jgi:para-nitrobenzyl esterase
MMRSITAASVLLSVSLLGLPATAKLTLGPIEIDTGRLQGQIRTASSGKPVIEYRGIPYAQNPTGMLRWSLPKPVTSWKGTLDASQFGPACPQISRFNLTDSSTEEDCLSINVSTPADLKPGEKLPVLFWIHGGAFVGGASNLYRLTNSPPKDGWSLSQRTIDSVFSDSYRFPAWLKSQ